MPTFEFDQISIAIVCCIIVLLAGFWILDYPPCDEVSVKHVQCIASPVRNANESSIYRSHVTPEGFPLMSGLGIRQGYGRRNGDLRDVFAIAKEGPMVGNNSWEDIERDVHALGKYLKSANVTRVLVILPNTIRNITTQFACAFYDITLCLKGNRTVSKGLEQALNIEASIVDEDGTVIHVLSSSDQAQRRSISWVELMAKSEGIIEINPQEKLTNPALVTLKDNKQFSYSHSNIISAVAGQMFGLPRQYRLNERDVFLSTNSFDDIPTRICMYAALASKSRLLLFKEPFTLEDIGTDPTFVYTSPQRLQALARLHNSYLKDVVASRWIAHGAHPPRWTRKMPWSLRVIKISVASEIEAPSQNQITQVQKVSGSRIVIGTCDPNVAGNITEKHPCDYTQNGGYGIPLPCVEVKTIGPDDTVLVNGPAALAPWVKTDLHGVFSELNTLQLK